MLSSRRVPPVHRIARPRPAWPSSASRAGAPRRLAARLAAAPATPGAAASQPAAAGQQPQPTFRAGVNFVRVDVIVSGPRRQAGRRPDAGRLRGDRGRQAADRSRRSSSSRWTASRSPATPAPRQIRTEYDEESEAARDDVRLFAIFLDDYHVRRSSAMGGEAGAVRLRPEAAGAGRPGRHHVPADAASAPSC